MSNPLVVDCVYQYSAECHMIDNKIQANLGQSETFYLNIGVINHDINGIFKFINEFIYGNQSMLLWQVGRE